MTDPLGTIATIPLSRGMVATIDAADLPLVAGRSWSAMKGKMGTFYAQSSDGKLMHRLILGEPLGMIVDHADNDGLNNRRRNLRSCTNAQNMANQRPRAGNSSRFKGVSLHKKPGRWEAKIHKNGRTIHLGEYIVEEIAAKQYDRAARLMFGEFAKTNEMLGLLPRASVNPPTL